MQEKYNADTRLRDLLVRFVEEEKLTPEVVLQTSNYLFDRNQYIPFFKDEELFETVVYLRDLMDLNELCNLDDILCYYQRKKERLRFFIQHSERRSGAASDQSTVAASQLVPGLFLAASNPIDIKSFAEANVMIMFCYAFAISYERCPDDHDAIAQTNDSDGFHEIHDCCRKLAPSQELVIC
jgi:hypothetical protein